MTQSFTPPKGPAPELESLTNALVHKKLVISEAMDTSIEAKDENNDESKDA